MSIPVKLAGNWGVGLSCLLACRALGQGYDWQPPPDKVTLLAVWAHPDDEGIFGGGSLPYYSTVLNMPTMLVSMTAGWGTVRDEEMRAAAWNYGLRYAPVFGRFADINSAAVANNPYTNSIDMTWDYWAGVGFRGDGSNVEAGKARAINFVAEQIRRYRPDVIITHDVNGETGHDNHKATAYAVMHAFFVAADPNATAANLVGLPPWQAQKLYVHLYPTNRLFHLLWEAPSPALTNLTPHQAANFGLTFHVSQGPLRWTCASVYPPAGIYNAWPSEWWGLYASMVGPDTVLSSNIAANGFVVPAGVAAEDFLENLPITELYFTAVPRSATVRAGASITLSAAAATTGSPPGYQWQFNGSGIDGATAASLVLSNVQPADAGSYTVVVTNTASSITSAVAVLTVLIPPTIIASPQTRTNLAGTAATFSATASGTGPLSYQWLLNGVRLRDNGNIVGANSGTLHILNVQPTNAGNFVLMVSSPAGIVSATVATLVVELPPPCLPAPPNLVGWWPGEGHAGDLAGTNDGALLGGATASTAGMAGLAFAFDGTNSFVQVPDAPELNPATLTLEGWVLFSALDSAASGDSTPGQQYIVFKQNSAGTNLEGFSLGKTRTDSGDVLSFTVSSAYGETVSLQSTTIVATGVWYYVAAARDSNSTSLYVNGQLEGQTNVDFPQDYGTNDLFFGSTGDPSWDHKFAGLLDEASLYGRALSSDEINAIYKAGASGKCREATFTTQPRSQTVLASSNVTFAVAAQGPSLSYQWLFNGTNVLDGATAASLVLSNVQPADAGRYTVVVTNKVSSVPSAVAVLTVLVPPVIIVSPETLTNLAGTAATFSATVNGTGPLSYQWLLNGVRLRDNGNIQGANASTLHILNVQPANGGNLVLAVSGPGGVATTTVATLVVKVPPTCVPVPPDLVGWWRGEGNGDDLAGTNNGALLGGATASAAGMTGLAFAFDGTNSFVQVPDSPELNPAELTLEGWVLFSALDSAGAGDSPPGQQYIVFKQNSAGTNLEGFSLGKTRTDSGDVFSFTVSSVDGETVSLQSTTIVATGVWYYVTAARDSNSTSLYVNGQLESQTNVTFPQDYGTNDLFFGSSGNPSWDHKFAGLLDEVSLYSRMLSADEINGIYGAEEAGKCREAVIATQPQSRTVVAGSSVTFAVAARGPALSYQWLFNGTNVLDGATAATLVLSDVRPADAGRYTVVVSNTASSITSVVAVLSVLIPPVIIASPQTRTNLVGTAATFSAAASGSGPLSYQWLLNGIGLRDNGNIRGATTGTLRIFNVQPANSGNLVLAVSSPGGVAASTVATLVVEPQPPCAPAPPDLAGWWRGEGNGDDLAGTNNGALLGNATTSTLGEVGQAFSFDGANDFVQIPDAPALNPTNLTIEAWVLFSSLDSDGSEAALPGQQYIVFKQNSSGTTSGGYQLGKARTADGDVFSFLVSSVTNEVCSLCSTTLVTTGLWYHVAGVRGSNFTRLYVNGQLESETNVVFPQDYGTNALFFGSSGDSAWDRKFAGLLDEVCLYSRALSADEIGAIYSAGSAGKCLEAAFTTQPESQTVLLGSNVTFTVNVSGPALNYQWYFNDTNVLDGATNSTLSLTNLSLSQSGNYSVIASNSTGAVFSQFAMLTVAPILGIVMPINLSGDVGSSWRIDYLNDLGPTNDWLALATVTLTNTSQVYLDASALSQPHRFYRLVPLP